MNDEELEKQLKEQLLNLWKNNPIFRDNIAYLTQVQLSFPQHLILDILERVEDLYYYELLEEPAPPMQNCIY